MDKDVVISVNNVYKNFILPHERTGSVKGVFTSMFSKATKKKETQHALNDITFEIKKGEFFGIVGRNGSGKSTLLKILAGIYQPTKGKVTTSGRLVPFIELGVGFNPELTGRDNVYLNGAILGFSVKEVDAMYDSIVEFAELERFMDQKLKNYSSGMQVRLAFSAAIRANADILLIDEVLAVGDADFQRKCYEYFNQLKRAKKTVIFVSHDMDAVQRYCDRSLILEDSRIIRIGDTRKVANDYIKLFIERETDTTSDQNENRWGDGSFIIDSISAKVSKESITITQNVKAVKDIESPSAGIRIRSSSGQAITGTSSELEHIKLPDLKAGESLTLKWEVPNMFSDGRYFVDPALSHDSGTNISDWWDEALSLTIKKERTLPYPVDPDFSLTVSSNK